MTATSEFKVFLA